MIVPVFKTLERVVIQFENSNNNNVSRSVSVLVIQLTGPVPYSPDKVVSYKYNATMIEKVTRSGRVFGHVPPRVVEDI